MSYIAEKIFFQDMNLDEARISEIVKQSLSGSDGGELFLELCQSESLFFDDGILKNADFNTRKGFGFRSFLDESKSFVCSSEITEKEISKAGVIVSSINSSKKNVNLILNDEAKKDLYADHNPLNREYMSFNKKVSFLQEIDSYLRSENQYVTQVQISLSGNWQVVSIIRADGRRVNDVRPLVRFNISVVLEKNGRKEIGSCGHGGRKLYKDFIDEKAWKGVAKEALRQALVNLESIPAPAGEMVVVLGAGWPGVLLHEAVGHGLEGDFNRKGLSAFSNSIGKRVAAKGITVVDDGTLPGRRGSLNVDDEGVSTNYTVLIEDGILTNYMQDCMNAKLMGKKSTGNGRRESYNHLVMPRMTNTYMLSGQRDPKEIISGVKKGLYAVNFGGGQVDITSGKFVFSASESYLIENGKVTTPVKGATLIGNGPDILTKVSMVGNDMKLDPGVGMCGKEGQQVPVGVGQPTLKIDAITVGGTSV